MVASPVSAAAGDITIADHEGQLTPLAAENWSNGNIKTYSEGDSINFRFDVSTLVDDSIGTIDVEFAEDDGKCLFFDGTFVLGTHNSSHPAVENVSGTSPAVSLVGGPTDVGDHWSQTVQFDFSDGPGEAVVYYYLTLSDDAGACVGSSTHTSFGDNGGDVGNTGSQEVSVPAKDVLVLPDITIYKVVDDDGDGLTDRPATAGEWDFTLDEGVPVPTDDAGKVVYENVAGGD
ncbi:MAG: hypothetical protein R3313_03305, partial [Candidatus Saccharimonadales bacterium]|nr:hypothetical protein [Candidatus Saccharimonadales bacterium]